MYIDALTIAGLISAASFILMPFLMGREFWRVADCEPPAADRDQRQTAQENDPRVLNAGCVDAA